MSATGYARVGTAPLGVTLGEALLPGWLRDRASTLPRDAVLVAGGVLLITLGAYISFTVPAIGFGNVYIPENPYVPISLQTLGVLFTGALLGSGRGIAAAGIYLLLGMVVSALNYVPPLFLITPVLSALAYGHYSLGLLHERRPSTPAIAVTASK